MEFNKKAGDEASLFKKITIYIFVFFLTQISLILCNLLCLVYFLKSLWFVFHGLEK